MKKKTKNILMISCFAVIAIIAAGGLAGYSYYKTFFAPNVFSFNEKESFINIGEDVQHIDTLLVRLNNCVEIRNRKTLQTAIKKLEFTDIKTGHYILSNGMTNRQLVLMLKSGRQTPIRLTFNNIHTKEQLAQRLSSRLMIDSLTIISFLDDADLVANHGFTPETVVAAFIPDTYEVYWNMSIDKLFDRMVAEYKKFWTEERLAKAAEIPFSPLEVATLASIVEDETNKDFEYPIIAGLYINRLRKGMLLQACPTVKFAVGDFGLRRVLKVHTQHQSPYNTYIHAGLPPGPVRLASPKVIDAVLNYDRNNYLFMAADAQFNGTHRFSSTLKDHNSAAREYQKELNRKKIY